MRKWAKKRGSSLRQMESESPEWKDLWKNRCNKSEKPLLIAYNKQMIVRQTDE